MKNIIRTIISTIIGAITGMWVYYLVAGTFNKFVLGALIGCMLTSFVVSAFVRLCIYWFDKIDELNMKIDWEEEI